MMPMENTNCSFHHAVIRAALNTERICFEALGSGLVAASAQQQQQHAAAGRGCIAFSIFHLVKRISLVAVVLAVVVSYYALHFLYITRQDENDVLRLVYGVDALTMIILLTFPFAGPLHRALGYFDASLDPLELQMRIGHFMNDVGTGQAINLTMVCVLGYSFGELFYFIALFDGIFLKMLYIVIILLNISCFYGATLLVILTMRAVLVRLYQIEGQVEDVLAKTDPLCSASYVYDMFLDTDTAVTSDGCAIVTATLTGTTNSSADNTDANCEEYRNSQSGGDEEEIIQLATNSSSSSNNNDDAQTLENIRKVFEWTHDYRIIRKDVQNLSQHFGIRMVLGLFIFSIDTTTLIAVFWERIGASLTATETACLLAIFVANAVMIMAALYSTAFIVLQCTSGIGPKLAVLAVRLHSDVPQYQPLSSAFLHAPVKIQVGVFEFAPEYANAIGLWFMGLFLVVFGLKVPGEG